MNGKLNGGQIFFTAGSTQYIDRVTGNAIDGMVKNGNKWTATRR